VTGRAEQARGGTGAKTSGATGGTNDRPRQTSGMAGGTSGATVDSSGAYGPVQRKEDARFIRGKGLFVDDIQLPGMLHGAILRSPLAHARILSIDTAAAQAHPRVEAVITGQTLAARNLSWMPTLSQDVQAVLATDKVRFQGQEVAFVIAQDRYSARDALELINVDYEPLPAVIDARHALDPDAPVIRDDVAGRSDNHIFDWTAGDRAATDKVFAAADVVVASDMIYPRSHPAPLETCGAVADLDQITGKLTVWSTTQAPHAHRTLYALVAGLPEHKIRIISPDIGGGFGNKVPIYPGYICAIVGSMVTGKPVKWVEDRSENLMSTSFARDYHMHGEIAATRAGRILGIRARVLADHGAFNGAAQPTKFPAGFFGIFTGSYDLQAAHCEVTGVYTNKAPGGVAYSCSFRITEAVYLVERMVDALARELDMDAAELRMKNLLRPEQFPYTCPTGWQYDSGDYPRALRLAMDIADYPGTAPRAGRAAAARRVHGHRDQLLHRGCRGRPEKSDGHSRPWHGRWRGPAGASNRQGCAQYLLPDSGPGPRDDVRPDRGAGAGPFPGRHRCRARRYRPDSVRARHLRLPVDPGLRGGGRCRGPQGAGAGQDRRLGDAGGRAGRSGLGRRQLAGAR